MSFLRTLILDLQIIHPVADFLYPSCVVRLSLNQTLSQFSQHLVVAVKVFKVVKVVQVVKVLAVVSC